MRGSFRLLVDTAPGLITVGEAGTGAEAVELARGTPAGRRADGHPDAGDGRHRGDPADLADPGPGPRVLILTTFDLDEYVYAALRAGASGFLLKDTPPADLLAAIRVVAAGEALLAPSVTRRLIAEFARRTPRGPRRSRAASTASPTANGRCSRSSPAACPTPRSPSTCTSARPR